MDIGTFLLMLALSYGLGLFWYDLLPGKLPEHAVRVAAYPFAGIFAAQALLPGMWHVFTQDFKVGGIGLITALIGSLVGVVVDWAVGQIRQPSTILPEMRGMGRQTATA